MSSVDLLKIPWAANLGNARLLTSCLCRADQASVGYLKALERIGERFPVAAFRLRSPGFVSAVTHLAWKEKAYIEFSSWSLRRSR